MVPSMSVGADEGSSRSGNGGRVEDVGDLLVVPFVNVGGGDLHDLVADRCVLGHLDVVVGPVEHGHVVVDVFDLDGQSAHVFQLGPPIVGRLDSHINRLLSCRLVTIENL